MGSEFSSNPYEPSDHSMDLEPVDQRVIHRPLVLSIQWTVVVLCNLIVPLLFGLALSRTDGIVGIAVAVVFMLVLGYFASIYLPFFVLFSVRGGLLVGVSQIIPVVHVLAGYVSMMLLRFVGLLEVDVLVGDKRIGFISAFLLTVLTGGILIMVACGLGLLMRLVTPDRWWLARRMPEQ